VSCGECVFDSDFVHESNWPRLCFIVPFESIGGTAARISGELRIPRSSTASKCGWLGTPAARDDN
jgi:hypothetical protein